MLAAPAIAARAAAAPVRFLLQPGSVSIGFRAYGLGLIAIDGHFTPLPRHPHARRRNPGPATSRSTAKVVQPANAVRHHDRRCARAGPAGRRALPRLSASTARCETAAARHPAAARHQRPIMLDWRGAGGSWSASRDDAAGGMGHGRAAAACRAGGADLADGRPAAGLRAGDRRTGSRSARPPSLPLRHGVFRALWAANVVTALGLWLQNTGRRLADDDAVARCAQRQPGAGGDDRADLPAGIAGRRAGRHRRPPPLPDRDPVWTMARRGRCWPR